MPETSTAAKTSGDGVSLLWTQDLLNAAGPAQDAKTALIYQGREISYGDLRAEVLRLACNLQQNLPPSALLAIWLPNCPELLALCLACLKCGVVPMPLHHGMKWPEVRAILDHSRAACLVGSRTSLDPHGAEIFDLGLKEICVINNDPASEPFRACSELALRQKEEPLQQTFLSSESLALVLHTSGSSGHAKGVMLSHGSLDHILKFRLTHTHLTADSLSIVASCLTQSVGFYQSLALLAAGGTIILLESYKTDLLADSINRHHPTHLIMVVEAFDRLLHDPSITAESFQNLSFASTGADRVTARVQNRFIALTGRTLSVSYGLTESSWALVNFSNRVDKSLALGQPCPGIQVKLVDTDGHEVAEGEIGEICIKGPRNLLGYLHDKEMTRVAFHDGWLLSGDLAYRDSEGYCWFAGRKKHLIVLASGDNVSPLEVENAILRHPSVSNCAVLGVATPQGSEVPWAVVVRSDQTLSEAPLAAFLRQRISDYKVPQRIVFVTDLPVGVTGKIQREELRKIFDLLT